MYRSLSAWTTYDGGTTKSAGRRLAGSCASAPSSMLVLSRLRSFTALLNSILFRMNARSVRVKTAFPRFAALYMSVVTQIMVGEENEAI